MLNVFDGRLLRGASVSFKNIVLSPRIQEGQERLVPAGGSSGPFAGGWLLSM